MRFHIHRWKTVETLTYDEYRRKYGTPGRPSPTIFIPPGYQDGILVGMDMQECRCGARRSQRKMAPFPPTDTWTRP